MDENAYIQDIIAGLGLALNEKNNSEIIINYPIKFDKKVRNLWLIQTTK